MQRPSRPPIDTQVGSVKMPPVSMNRSGMHQPLSSPASHSESAADSSGGTSDPGTQLAPSQHGSKADGSATAPGGGFSQVYSSASDSDSPSEPSSQESGSHTPVDAPVVGSTHGMQR